jgi:hypothetical protein
VVVASLRVTRSDTNVEAPMTDKRAPKDAETAPPAENDQDLPFRRSSSAGEYNPEGNWAAERRLDAPISNGQPGMQGEASGAGDGGFGPEGDFSKDVHADDAPKRARDAAADRDER